MTEQKIKRNRAEQNRKIKPSREKRIMMWKAKICDEHHHQKADTQNRDNFVGVTCWITNNVIIWDVNLVHFLISFFFPPGMIVISYVDWLLNDSIDLDIMKGCIRSHMERK